MKDGVFIINCARGGIVSEDDISEAISSGKVGGLALDVFNPEPPDFSSPVFKLEIVVITFSGCIICTMLLPLLAVFLILKL